MVTAEFFHVDLVYIFENFNLTPNLIVTTYHNCNNYNPLIKIIPTHAYIVENIHETPSTSIPQKKKENVLHERDDVLHL